MMRNVTSRQQHLERRPNHTAGSLDMGHPKILDATGYHLQSCDLVRSHAGWWWVGCILRAKVNRDTIFNVETMFFIVFPTAASIRATLFLYLSYRICARGPWDFINFPSRIGILRSMPMSPRDTTYCYGSVVPYDSYPERSHLDVAERSYVKSKR